MSAKRECEEKQVSSFVPSWKTQFSWVDSDPSVPEMLCNVCRENPNQADKSVSFFVGTKTFRKQWFESHDKSLHHVTCVAAK